MKTCSKCKDNKDESEFYQYSSVNKKLRSQCKKCTALIQNQRLHKQGKIKRYKDEPKHDLKDREFGFLKVLYKTESKKIDDKWGYVWHWMCQCKCGKLKEFPAHRLINLESRTCGCRLTRSGANTGKWSGFEEITGSFWCRVKLNAEKRHIEFNIDIEYAWDIFVKQERKCVLSGIPIGFGKLYKNISKTTASLDRIDSSKGYIKNNIQWVHKDINKMKSNLNQEAFIRYCYMVVDHDKS